MLFQLSEFILGFSMTLLSYSIAIGIQVIILILGYLIYKRNSSIYGRYFMISAICSIISFFLSAFIWNIRSALIFRTILIFIPTSIGIVGTVFLILAIYKVYDSHRMDIVE